MGESNTPNTTMVPRIWEGWNEPANGYVNYHYQDGSDYSGYMINSLRNGYGILRRAILTYIGLWEDDMIMQGVMIDAVRATEFQIGPAEYPQEWSRAPDPQ